MKNLYLMALLLLLAACGTDSGRFRLEGRLRNINQGEFYVYSNDGTLLGIDTIGVRDGRFAYEIELRRKGTLIIIFPNYSEQPVFGEPGATVTIGGDASHMKEMTIKGTKDNELMTELRMQLNELMPPQVPKAVAKFIEEHKESPVCTYLLQRYFLQSRQPDYKEARRLVALLTQEHPEDIQLAALAKQIDRLQGGQLQSQLPQFTATDVKGQRITESSLKAKVNVVTAWASWSYRSTDVQRRLKLLKERYGNQLAVVSICLDARSEDCRRTVVTRDSLKWPTVCDGHMWDTPLLQKFGIATVPANLIANEQGRIVARNLTAAKLEEQINDMLK